MAHVNPSLEQNSFRARNDDGSESAATWKATANTNWTQAVDENFRVRFLVQETAGGSENNFNPQLQYNLNGAGWNNVSDLSSVVRASASANLTEGEDTTQQIGAGTFISPNSGVDEVNGLAGEANDIDFAGNDEVEVEYCCQIRSADVADADTVQLRLTRSGGTVLETYTNTPSITVSETVARQVDMAVTLPALTGSFDTAVTVKADLAATLPSLTASFDAGVTVKGDLAATLPAITASFDVSASAERTVDMAVTLPSLTAAFDTGVLVAGDMAATLPALTGSFDAAVTAKADMAATLPALTGNFDTKVGVASDLSVSLPALTATMDAKVLVAADLSATLPAMTASFSIGETAPVAPVWTRGATLTQRVGRPLMHVCRN